MLQKVLIIEDDINYQNEYIEKLAGKVQTLCAFSIEQAHELFRANPDVAVITLDACVPGDKPTTQSLVREFRITFKGPIIAASSSQDYCKLLLEAGCDYESLKKWLPEKVLEILHLTTTPTI